MRRLLWALGVLVVLAVVADFGAKLLVENLAARALSNRRGVDGSVDVSFGGFPFLLHLKDRRFASVTVGAQNVRGGSFATASGIDARSEVDIASVRLEMHDVEIDGNPWGDDADVGLTARTGEGTAALTGAELNRLVPARYPVRLQLLPGAVRVTASTPAGEQTTDVPEEAVRVEPDGTLIVEAPPPVGAMAIPLPQLVDGVTFERVDVTRGRLEVTLSMQDVKVSL